MLVGLMEKVHPVQSLPQVQATYGQPGPLNMPVQPSAAQCQIDTAPNPLWPSDQSRRALKTKSCHQVITLDNRKCIAHLLMVMAKQKYPGRKGGLMPHGLPARNTHKQKPPDLLFCQIPNYSCEMPFNSVINPNAKVLDHSFRYYKMNFQSFPVQSSSTRTIVSKVEKGVK